MFELLVEILHRDDSWTREPYVTCQIMRHSVTGETRRVCKPIRFSTHAACLAQIGELDRDWRAGAGLKDGPRGWVRWEMRCEEVAGPPIS